MSNEATREDIARKLHALLGGELMYGTIKIKNRVGGLVEVVCERDSVSLLGACAAAHARLPGGMSFRQIARYIEQQVGRVQEGARA